MILFWLNENSQEFISTKNKLAVALSWGVTLLA